jgi:hypothetical protein
LHAQAAQQQQQQAQYPRHLLKTAALHHSHTHSYHHHHLQLFPNPQLLLLLLLQGDQARSQPGLFAAYLQHLLQCL